MKKFNQLSRAEMRNVKGGVLQATCSATCTGSIGLTWTVTCEGTMCEATDNDGCVGDNGRGDLDIENCGSV